LLTDEGIQSHMQCGEPMDEIREYKGTQLRSSFSVCVPETSGASRKTTENGLWLCHGGTSSVEIVRFSKIQPHPTEIPPLFKKPIWTSPYLGYLLKLVLKVRNYLHP
jgi:hypothetical protein